MHRNRRASEKWRSLYLWHRYAGLAAAVLALWLAVTGITLNHTEDLKLSRRFVQQDWLLSLYNIKPPENISGQRVEGWWLARSGNRVYVNDAFIGHGALVDAAPTAFGIVVAFEDRLQLYTANIELIETLPSPTATPILGIAATQDGVVITAATETFLADTDFTNFAPAPLMDIALPETQPLPATLAQTIAQDVLYHSLDWERVLLDLHSGRTFGKAGTWIADIAGALLILLAITGILVWAQRASARNRR